MTTQQLQNPLNRLKDKERLSFILMDHSTDNYRKCLLYIVFKTIETNRNITANQLGTALESSLPVKAEDVQQAIKALTSPSLFNCVSRWQPPKTQAIHLRVKKEFDFSNWLTDTVKSIPELHAFDVPVILKSANQH